MSKVQAGVSGHLVPVYVPGRPGVRMGWQAHGDDGSVAFVRVGSSEITTLCPPRQKVSSPTRRVVHQGDAERETGSRSSSRGIPRGYDPYGF
jgi:hypothetical protein